MAWPHVGDIGSEITYFASEDISDATLLKLKYNKPSGATGEWVATLRGTTAAVYTTTQASDLDEVGDWELQLYKEGPSWSGHATKQKFTVLPVIGT